jgi:hypothetical protein
MNFDNLNSRDLTVAAAKLTAIERIANCTSEDVRTQTIRIHDDVEDVHVVSDVEDVIRKLVTTPLSSQDATRAVERRVRASVISALDDGILADLRNRLWIEFNRVSPFEWNVFMNVYRLVGVMEAQ